MKIKRGDMVEVIIGDDVGGPPRRSRRELHGALGVGAGLVVGWRPRPAHVRVGDEEALARLDAHQRSDRLASGQIRRGDGVVVAFRAQHHRGVRGGLLGAAAGLHPTLRRALDLADVTLDGLPQAFVGHALDHGLGLVCPGRSVQGEHGR